MPWQFNKFQFFWRRNLGLRRTRWFWVYFCHELYLFWLISKWISICPGFPSSLSFLVKWHGVNYFLKCFWLTLKICYYIFEGHKTLCIELSSKWFTRRIYFLYFIWFILVNYQGRKTHGPFWEVETCFKWIFAFWKFFFCLIWVVTRYLFLFDFYSPWVNPR